MPKAPLVALVDYGLGNLFSVRRALEHVGAQVRVADRPEALGQADRLVLPGVGAFAQGMAGLTERGLADAVSQFARSGKPVLGLCLGMQLLMSRGTEFGDHAGLDLIGGRVVALDPDAAPVRLKLPHIGWAGLRPSAIGWADTPLRDLSEGDEVYFVHSYAAVCDDAASELARSAYGEADFCAAVKKGNIVGCQFHPEKSGPIGLKILHRFIS